MIYYDNIFDKRFLFEFTHKLSVRNMWSASNTANRNTYPYGESGSHVMLGHLVFLNQEVPKFTEHKDLFEECFTFFKGVSAHENTNYQLKEISLNLGFKDMGASLHVDGTDDQTAFIIMLTNDDVTEEDGGSFYNKTVDQTVPFKNGRVIKFKASDLHRGHNFNKPNLKRFSLKLLCQS